MGTARLDMARRFDAPEKGWEAPPRRVGTFRENLKGMVQNAVTNAFLPLTRQYDELNKAEAMLADSPTGKALMDTSEKGHVLTRLDTQMDSRGVYQPFTRMLGINPRYMTLTEGSKGYRGCMTHVLGHEHFHVFQHHRNTTRPEGDSLRGFNNDGVVALGTHDPRETIMYKMHMEAAAHAMQAQIGWELKDKHPEVMADLEADHEFAPVMAAYKQAAEADPDAVHDGRALRAAHDEWFSPDGYTFGHYQARAIADYKASLSLSENYLDTLAPEKAAEEAPKLGRMRISGEQMKETGALPNGTNHMTLPGYPEPDSDCYAKAFEKRFEQELEEIYTRMENIRGNYALDTAQSPAPEPVRTRKSIPDIQPG